MVAMVDRDDPYHPHCLTALDRLVTDGFVTTWPCLTEAMYRLGRRLGSPGQEHLWELVADESITMHLPAAGEWKRMRELMRKYQDAPMDLADASLVTAAEHRGIRQIFTVDRHFNAYRIAGRHAFDLVA